MAAPFTVETSRFSSITTFLLKQNYQISSYNLMVHEDDASCLSIIKLRLSIERFSEGWEELWKCEKVRLVFRNTVQTINKLKIDAKLDSYDNEVYLLAASRNCIYCTKITKMEALTTVLELS